MKRIFPILLQVSVILSFLLFSCVTDKEIRISIVETTDIHGVILPWDYTEGEALDASLASASSLIKNLKSKKDAVVLLDNGDNLQGQPAVYYYNFIDTVSPHILSEAFNWLGYDACSVGNHDIEAGHPVYDRLTREYDFPMLAANAVDKRTGKPYFEPFVIIEKQKIKIAVLGLVTPAIPTWLPEELYKGIEFRDMVETAELWMPEILKKKPDVVIGLFHAGWNIFNDEYKTESPMNENASASVAWKVPGFDIIFCGHDHRSANEKFVNSVGDTLLILNAGSRSELAAVADLILSATHIGKKKIKSVTGNLTELKNIEPDSEFILKFKPYDQTVRNYVDRVIGTSNASFTSRDSYFGSSAFTDMIHALQLEITGADISFAAPLSFDVEISAGPVRVGDIFKLYRYENKLYTMTLNGQEIKDYLEYSYSEWINTMSGPGDFLLRYRTDKEGKPVLTNGRPWLAYPSYNFDSGAGISYTVDVSKPEGRRINILSLTDGNPFNPEKTYRVAMNSYRANGGGGHLTRGAGIEQDELRSRLVASTDRDLRYYIMKNIEEKGVLRPEPMNNWEFVPEKWIKIRAPVEYLLLFGETK